MNFKDLNLQSTNTKTKILNGQIEVIDYLPVREKVELIAYVLTKSEDENGLYNPILLDKFLHLGIVYSYTDIVFSLEERIDDDTLYDVLETSGVIKEVLEAIPEKEYEYLCGVIEDSVDSLEEYNSSGACLVNSFIRNLPKNAEEVVNIMSEFDPEKASSVMEFAKAVNGNREI